MSVFDSHARSKCCPAIAGELNSKEMDGVLQESGIKVSD